MAAQTRARRSPGLDLAVPRQVVESDLQEDHELAQASEIGRHLKAAMQDGEKCVAIRLCLCCAPNRIN
jgi:hypothetical protein